mmetsp:Transcript_42194/g.68453  ORF Transcript_42194/g.68453 Transcript_42194/m.68453 type:complete len:290 (-) Transcript_42194:117-986(-)|eukprot:CAMPEP_0184644120 /NCGR_PEP_ID=MMETSP0308-20130426/876_1 /TAXON_ID=38269 /ORGANISM="Gloeochaete witrockiana, Strain SAG 46.84" /LENGTH=289 /DNA_ID=CAMNT_0027072455 /DNA_START=128 /DNA_END=997 /DNA_ORIENTATION=+
MSKLAIAELIRRIELVEFETGDGKTTKKKKSKEELQDEFTNLKKEIGRQISEIRKAIKERDEMNVKKVGRKEIVEKSAHVRQLLRTVKEDSARLRQLLQQQERKKVKGKPYLTEEKLQVRQDMVKLVFDHIEECEQLEKRRYAGDKSEKDRANLLRGASTASSSKQTYQRSAMDSELPDLEDPELEEGLAKLRKKNEELDKDLDQISKGVGELGQLAQNMNSEVRLQSSMLDELQDKVDKTRDHMQNTNKRMKMLVEKIAPPQRFCVDIVLLVILVALGGVIYTIVVKP